MNAVNIMLCWNRNSDNVALVEHPAKQSIDYDYTGIGR